MTITVISNSACTLHNMDPEHPEHPNRLHKINDQLIASGLELVLRFADAKPASKEYLALAHDPDFVQSIFDKAPKEKSERVWIDDDTIMMEHSLKAALCSAGAGRTAVDQVMNGETSQAFCAVRPPGHHAGHATSSGFCLFSNIAIAAKYALKEYKLNRVAIIDFDVHHGNGTEDIVQGDERILFCSSFQHPFYPYSGTENTASNVLNIPIPAGTQGAEYFQLIAPWWDALDAFAPELIFISAGFDAHAEDDLGHLRLVEADYSEITSKLAALAQKHSQGRIVSMLEGGYALSALSRSVVAHLKAMLA